MFNWADDLFSLPVLLVAAFFGWLVWEFIFWLFSFVNITIG